MDLELIIFEIISNAGMVKSICYEALDLANKGKINKAYDKLKETDEFLLNAHKIQTDIIQKEASGEHINVSVLFVHAQDHLMSAMEIKNLTTHILKMSERIENLENK